MTTDDIEDTKEFWDATARDWEIQVGDDGDVNRILNSDPVLWQFAGDVAGLTVLDAGCGTGYLSRKLLENGASVIGIDFSEKMIEIARRKAPKIDFRLDSCSELRTVAESEVDMVISNYVLMDTPDLLGAMRAFNRVLKPGGIAILVFSHPCFPAGWSSDSVEEGIIEFHWRFPYFEQRKCVDPPWAHFTTDFIWFHRPLSDYWKAFKAAQFDVLDFEEPRLTEERYHLAESERMLKKSVSRPFSVAFKLQSADKLAG